MADLTLETPSYAESDLPRTVRRLHDYAGALTEQLRYVLMHLDEENVPALGGLQQELADAAGNLSVLSQTAAALLARVENAEGGLSSLILTAEGLATRVESAEGGLSTLTQTANGLTARVQSAEGAISTLNQTANSLTSRVQSAEGSLSTVQQTASGLTTQVSDLSGKYTSLKQTVDGFDFTGLVTFTDLDDELAAYPTETDLRRGRTTISGDCITTGMVSLDYLDISNGYGSLTIESGSNGVWGTKGPCLTGPDSDIYFIVTNSACRMTAYDNSFYVSETRVHSDTEVDVGSDARLKNTITYDLGAKYGDFFRRLRPCRFKYNNGTSDRFHTGLIAQDVEQALADGGLTTQDLAALVIGEDGGYAIRYAELIALNTAMIQRLLDRVDALEATQEGGNP